MLLNWELTMDHQWSIGTILKGAVKIFQAVLLTCLSMDYDTVPVPASQVF